MNKDNDGEDSNKKQLTAQLLWDGMAREDVDPEAIFDVFLSICKRLDLDPSGVIHSRRR